jgi:hypothetical protein
MVHLLALALARAFFFFRLRTGKLSGVSPNGQLQRQVGVFLDTDHHRIEQGRDRSIDAVASLRTCFEICHSALRQCAKTSTSLIIIKYTYDCTIGLLPITEPTARAHTNHTYGTNVDTYAYVQSRQ